MPHQLYAGGLQARDSYPELRKYFYKEHSDMTWEEFLATKFELWIDTRSVTDNTLHGSGRPVNQSGILLQIEKAPEASGGDLPCYMFSLKDAVAHLSVTNPSSILTIEKSIEGRIGKFLGLLQIEKLLVILDKREIRARNDFDLKY